MDTKQIVETTREITATILLLQGFKPKPEAKQGFCGEQCEAIRMVVWEADGQYIIPHTSNNYTIIDRIVSEPMSEKSGIGSVPP